VPEVGKRCLGIRRGRFGRHDLIDVLGECGDQQLQGLGIAFLERRVQNRTGFGAELGICLRGKARVALAETCGAADGRGPMVTAGEQTREQGRQEERGRESGTRRVRNRHSPGCRGLRILRGGVVAAGLRDGRSPQGADEGDAADNGAAHRAAEPADEARTSPLVGLGRKAGGEERGSHWRGVCSGYDILFKDGEPNETIFSLGGSWPSQGPFLQRTDTHGLYATDAWAKHRQQFQGLRALQVISLGY